MTESLCLDLWKKREALCMLSNIKEALCAQEVEEERVRPSIPSKCRKREALYT